MVVVQALENKKNNSIYPMKLIDPILQAPTSSMLTSNTWKDIQVNPPTKHKKKKLLEYCQTYNKPLIF